MTIGRACMLRSTTIQDEVIIGDKCILMEGSLVETQSILAPGTVLPPGRYVGSGEVWAGNPARFVRKLLKDEVSKLLTPEFICGNTCEGTLTSNISCNCNRYILLLKLKLIHTRSSHIRSHLKACCLTKLVFAAESPDSKRCQCIFPAGQHARRAVPATQHCLH